MKDKTSIMHPAAGKTSKSPMAGILTALAAAAVLALASFPPSTGANAAGGDGAANNAAAGGAEDKNSRREAGEVIQLTDLASREVRLARRATRILAINSASRFIAYLGCAGMLAGVENIDKTFTNTRAYTIANRALFEKLPLAGEGGAGKPVDLEKIISLAPEVIFEAFADREAADTLQKRTAIPVVSLGYGDKSWYDENAFFASLNAAAAVTGRETRAAELIKFVCDMNADLARRVSAGGAGKNGGPRCYAGAMAFRGRQGISSTDSAYAPFIKAGVENVVTEKAGANSHIFLDREKLLVYDPEFIFIDAAGLSMVNEDYIKNREYYTRLSAVKNKKVYLCLPSVFYYLNIETLYINSYFIGKITRPAEFADIDPAAKADEIFEKFCGAKCYETVNREYGAFARLEFGDGGVTLEKY